MLVATPQMRKRTGLVYFSWLVVAMVYYGGMIMNVFAIFVFLLVFVFAFVFAVVFAFVFEVFPNRSAKGAVPSH